MPLHLSGNDAAALLVDPQLALYAFDGIFADTTAASSTAALAEFLEDIKANIGDK